MACRNTMMMPNSDHNIRHLKSPSDIDLCPTSDRCGLNFSLDIEGSIRRIRGMLNKAEVSISANDTAPVAMVPSRELPDRPCFPECVHWVMENQQQIGSWSVRPKHRLPDKHSLSPTLAHLLALRKWRLGEQLLRRVSTIYPTNILLRIQIVDTFEKLGVQRYFKREIERILNKTYRSWQQKNEEIFSDVTCCAMAFRLLRFRGYDVSADELAGFVDQEYFVSIVGRRFTSVTTILELYKASQLIIYPNEVILQKIHAWTSTYLKHQLLNQSILDNNLRKEVESALKNYHGTLARVMNRQNIELYDLDRCKILNTVSRDILIFSVQDFNAVQALHQAELQTLERWYEKNELHSSRIPKRIVHSCYFMITADIFEPELSDARISYAKTCVLITVVDDLFDNCASREELVNLIELVKIWDRKSFTDCCSKQVRIFLLALYNTIDELAERAFVHQGRCIKQHLISMWQELLEGMMTELHWWRENLASSMDEYLSVGRTTIGSKICTLTGLYFLGPKLSEEILNSEETKSLSKHVSTVSRLLNDIQTYEKELKERKPNSVSILANRGHGVMKMKEARTKIQEMIGSNRRQLLKMVLQTKGSLVPRMFKDLFLTTTKISFYLYKFTNEYDSPKEMTNDTNKLIYEPLKLPQTIYVQVEKNKEIKRDEQ